MKKVIMLVAVVMLMACSSQPLIVHNNCKGSWVRVREGDGNILVQRLDYGQEVAIEVDGMRGRTVYLYANGFRLTDNKPLGGTETSRYIPDSGGFVTSPSDIYPWRIDFLYSTDPNGGCQR